MDTSVHTLTPVLTHLPALTFLLVVAVVVWRVTVEIQLELRVRRRVTELTAQLPVQLAATVGALPETGELPGERAQQSTTADARSTR